MESMVKPIVNIRYKPVINTEMLHHYRKHGQNHCQHQVQACNKHRDVTPLQKAWSFPLSISGTSYTTTESMVKTIVIIWYKPVINKGILHHYRKHGQNHCHHQVQACNKQRHITLLWKPWLNPLSTPYTVLK